MSTSEQKSNYQFKVVPVTDQRGNIYAYRCPHCGSISPYESIAEECLRAHAQTLVEG